MRTVISEQRGERIRQVLARRQPDLTVIIDNVHDPHNVAAVLRSCDAFGVLGVHLYYTTDPYPQLSKKVSGSARKWVRRTRWFDAAQMSAALRGQNMQVLATGFSARSRPLPAWDFTRPTAVVLSNEHSGIKPELQALADGEITIPMLGMVQSLNVSVAAGIILYEAWRQRQAAGMYDRPGLPADELEAMEAEWRQR